MMHHMSLLFYEGATKGQSLPDVLNNHCKQISDRIRRISDVGEMTEPFLKKLIKGSLIEGISLNLGSKYRTTRTEDIPSKWHPQTFSCYFDEDIKSCPRTVARIHIPYSGDKTLFRHCPSTYSTVFPRAEIINGTVVFDVILFGSSEEHQKETKSRIDEQIQSLIFYVNNANKDVNAFNKSLPKQITSDFETKLDELAKQHLILDGFGIPEKPEIISTPRETSKASKTARPYQTVPQFVQIIQYIENQYVENLTQINLNIGDVNNAIQSD